MDFDPRDFDDARDRTEDLRDRDRDARDVFSRDLDLPEGREREIVRDRDREYTLRGSESRTLATVGAFRVLSSRDLRDHHDRPGDPRSGDLRHLREQRLVETTRLPGSRDYAISLTKEGRSLLESHREGATASAPSQPPPPPPLSISEQLTRDWHRSVGRA
jgi:hypothetical protein